VIEGVLVFVMVWTQVAVMPWLSTAVQVRAMIEPAQFAPTMESLWLTVTELQPSDAVAVPVTDGSVGELQSIVTSGGQVMVGGALSTVVSSTLHVFWTPPPKLRMTRTVTDPMLAVCTVTWQLVVRPHELAPTKVAPAVLLINDHVAVKGVPGRIGAVATKVAAVPQPVELGPVIRQ
jgi:hypothetical protein